MVELQLFPGSSESDIGVLGGKGASLVRMQLAGLPVPPGGVLTTAFFEPWFDAIRADPAWEAVQAAGPAGWDAACPAVQARVTELPLGNGQRAAIDALLQALPGDRFAVRSSSPEEDLESASFAGGYETRLGVTPAGLEEAIRACFASSLAARVLRYKHEHGFDAYAPSLAVVVQAQLDSERAGVGFSLNPQTNDYDEAVIDAAWGLGESVVAGLTTPDHVVANKLDGTVIERTLGGKQASIWLLPEGGTETREGYRADEPCLTDADIAELTDVIGRVEAFFGRPVDIEWAYADGSLHLLQARPVTAYVPLPPELITAPGERRRLYMDASLSNGLTLNVPVSPLALDWLYEIFTQLLEFFVGPLPRHLPPEEAIFFIAGGRLYTNLSQMLWVQTPSLLERGNRGVDALMGATLGSIDAKRYRSRKLPPFFSLRSVARLPRMVWASRELVWRMIRTLIAPDNALRRYEEDAAAVLSALKEEPAAEATFEEHLQQGFDELFHNGFAAMWSSLGAYGIALGVVDFLARGVDHELAMRLQQGFAGNVVVEMGIELHALAGMLEEEDFADREQLAARIRDRSMPEPFLDDWDAFLDRFGARGPIEMDLASPRYRDDPRLAVDQMAAMRGTQGPDPGEVHARLLAQRVEAFEQLCARSGRLRRWLLRGPNHLLELFAGTRDTPKHLLAHYNAGLRRTALKQGDAWVAQGRIDAPEHIFDLHLQQLDAVRRDPTIDVRALRRDNIAFLERLRRANLMFPPVIDSRGRIIRPPRHDATPGELTGMGVSPGTASGRVRLLHSPHDQTIEPGEVLVAYTTDPGWTPLFVNAAALVLEIGGTLQHGALVAREYGKPCVVGISQVLERLEDGQHVEVDGTNGVVRVVPPA